MSRRRRLISFGNGLSIRQGLTLWLDASDTSTITDSSGSVSVWADKSGNDIDATQGTGSAQPTTGVQTANGKNVLVFDGTNDYMDIGSGIYGLPNDDNTIFIVSRLNAAGIQERVMSMGVSGSSRQTVGYTGAGDAFFVNNSVFDQVIAGATIGQFNVLTCFKNGTTQSISINGGTAVTDTAGTNTAGVNQARIGTNPAVNADFLDGAVGEIIAYNRVLSASEISLVNSYLINKWGI